MPSVVRNVTVKASNLLNHWMGAHMSDNQVDVKNTANQIRIETVYYRKSLIYLVIKALYY